MALRLKQLRKNCLFYFVNSFISGTLSAQIARFSHSAANECIQVQVSSSILLRHNRFFCPSSFYIVTSPSYQWRNLCLSSKNEASSGLQADPVSYVYKCLKSGKEDIKEVLANNNIQLFPRLVYELLGRLRSRPDLALKFFLFAKSQPKCARASVLYDAMINIAGHNKRFKEMIILINEMAELGLWSTEKAYLFLSESPLDEDTIQGITSVYENLIPSARVMMLKCLKSFLDEMKPSDDSYRALRTILDNKKRSLTVSTYNSLIASECRRSRVSNARKLLLEMKKSGLQPNVTSYNYIIGALCKNGNVVESCRLIEEMEKCGIPPDSRTYHDLISSFSKEGHMDRALLLLRRMFEDGFKPMLVTYAVCIREYCNRGRFTEARNLISEISAKAPSGDSANYELLARLYYKSSMMAEAQRVLLEMTDKGLIPDSWLCKKIQRGLMLTGQHHLCRELNDKLLYTISLKRKTDLKRDH